MRSQIESKKEKFIDGVDGGFKIFWMKSYFLNLNFAFAPLGQLPKDADLLTTTLVCSQSSKISYFRQ